MTARRSPARRLLRATIRVVLVLAVIGVVGRLGLGWLEDDQRRRFPPPGSLVEVDGGRVVHLRTWGAEHAATGRPTIVLDVGANTPSSAWAWIAQELAGDHRVVAYDRPGMGWSRPADGQRDAGSAASALHQALAASGIGPPYVVIGHSYGGLSARLFSAAHRDDVEALVLLDTTHPSGTGTGFAAYYRARAWIGHTGLYQLLRSQSGGWFGGLPAGEREAADAVSIWTSHLDASADELEAWTASVEQVLAAGDLGDMPVLVVTTPGSAAQMQMQREIASISTRSRLVELDVGHLTMLTERDQAALVVEEIRRFLAELD